MSYSNSISIGPEFFAKAKNDYADFSWALVREFFQNSIDAPGCKKIDVQVHTVEGGVTKMVVTNDGAPMTREILTNKLLSLGGSGKGFNGTVGGFGKAKEVLYFCHRSYQIHTGDLLVQGSGAGYDLNESVPDALSGTSSTIVLDCDLTTRLCKTVEKFASYAQWDGSITLNGGQLACNLRKGSPRREFEWGTVYTNKSDKNRVVVRVGGIPMFSAYTSFDRMVVVELKGASVDVLTSNRDSLVWRFQDQFDKFLMDLVVNRSKALKSQNPTYQHFSGAKFKTSKENPERKSSGVSARELVGAKQNVSVAAFMGSGSSTGSGGFGGIAVSGERLGVVGSVDDYANESIATASSSPTSTISEEFVLKNETTLKIPDYFQPDSDQFGSYAKKLARMWGRLIVELHRLFETEAEFGIGFVLSDDCEAQYEKTKEFGVVYYLNPAVVVEQVSSASKSLKKRFQLTERDRLLSIAVHEFVHGLGYGSHDEAYAGKLTDVFAKVMKERKRFNWCFA